MIRQLAVRWHIDQVDHGVVDDLPQCLSILNGLSSLRIDTNERHGDPPCMVLPIWRRCAESATGAEPNRQAEYWSRKRGLTPYRRKTSRFVGIGIRSRITLRLMVRANFEV